MHQEVVFKYRSRRVSARNLPLDPPTPLLNEEDEVRGDFPVRNRVGLHLLERFVGLGRGSGAEPDVGEDEADMWIETR